MHNRSYNEQDAIQRLLLFEEGLSRLIELMKIEKKDVLGNDMDFLCQSIMQDVCRKCPKYRECYGSRQKETIGEIASILEQAYQCSGVDGRMASSEFRRNYGFSKVSQSLCFFSAIYGRNIMVISSHLSKHILGTRV